MNHITHDSFTPPKLIVVMGVSGSGKSTVAERLAQLYGFRYLDADDFHTDEAKAQMAAGIPLTDEMRLPWVHNICAHLEECATKGISCVLAFSGLRRAHREQFRPLPFDGLFIYLDGDKQTIMDRMNSRDGHFMPASLLDSQMDSMEDSSGETDVARVDITPALPQVIDACCQCVNDRLVES